MVDQVNYALVEKTRPMMYKAMKYWGKKPHNIFRTYIEHYSEPNEIVLDAFAGSGVCPLEAIQTGRKAIAVDLNPVASYMTRTLATPLDIQKFEREWATVKSDLLKLERSSGLFLTRCPACKNNARIINVHYDGVPVKIRYKCSCSKNNNSKPVEKEDLDLIGKSEKTDIEWWFPKDKFPDTESFYGAKKNAGDYFYNLWTRRNLYALSCIFDRINKIEDKVIKEFFRFAFISMAHLCTRMVSARREKSNRPDSGSWGRPAYMFPKRHLEQNPFLLFERAIEDRQGIIKAKESSNRLVDGKTKFAKNFEDLKNNDKNLLILNKNTIELSKFIPEESVDYVLTDPPYGGLIKYFDLSSLWSIWLKGQEQNEDFDIVYNEEIILDKERGFDYYDRMLYRAFCEINKVLKQNKYLTVTFHNSQPRIFNSIIKSCINAGFVLEKILFQQNRRASESGVANPWGTAISDFYLRFRKPTKEEKKIEGLNRGNFEKMVVNSAKEVIARRGQPTEMTHIINGVYMELYKYGQFLETNEEDIANILKKRIGKEFELVEPDESNIKKGGRWWFTETEKKKLNLKTPLSDRVEQAIIETFHSKVKVSYDEILQTLFIKFPNSLTPDYNSINNLIKEYGTRQKGGTWMLKETFRQNENKHLLMEKILAKIGKHFGYKIWCPDRNKDSELKDICENGIPFSFERKDRVEEIDVVWFRDNKIYYVFEVENSTTITSALERGSNLPDRNNTKKLILIPKDRARFLERKVREPMFKETFILDKWQVAFYEGLEEFARKRKITEKEFNSIFSEGIKPKGIVQAKLS
ncbi:MAG: DNA methyltransferase [Candidatus Aenigmatarchaeota archaeon]